MRGILSLVGSGTKLSPLYHTRVLFNVILFQFCFQTIMGQPILRGTLLFMVDYSHLEVLGRMTLDKTVQSNHFLVQ